MAQWPPLRLCAPRRKWRHSRKRIPALGQTCSRAADNPLMRYRPGSAKSRLGTSSSRRWAYGGRARFGHTAGARPTITIGPHKIRTAAAFLIMHHDPREGYRRRCKAPAQRFGQSRLRGSRNHADADQVVQHGPVSVSGGYGTASAGFRYRCKPATSPVGWPSARDALGLPFRCSFAIMTRSGLARIMAANPDSTGNHDVGIGRRFHLHRPRNDSGGIDATVSMQSHGEKAPAWYHSRHGRRRTSYCWVRSHVRTQMCLRGGS